MSLISSLPACVRKPTGAPYVRPDIMSHSTAASGSTQAKESRAETMWEWEVKTHAWSHTQFDSSGRAPRLFEKVEVKHPLIFMAYPVFQKSGAISGPLDFWRDHIPLLTVGS